MSAAAAPCGCGVPGNGRVLRLPGVPLVRWVRTGPGGPALWVQVRRAEIPMAADRGCLVG